MGTVTFPNGHSHFPNGHTDFSNGHSHFQMSTLTFQMGTDFAKWCAHLHNGVPNRAQLSSFDASPPWGATGRLWTPDVANGRGVGGGDMPGICASSGKAVRYSTVCGVGMSSTNINSLGQLMGPFCEVWQALALSVRRSIYARVYALRYHLNPFLWAPPLPPGGVLGR